MGEIDAPETNGDGGSNAPPDGERVCWCGERDGLVVHGPEISSYHHSTRDGEHQPGLVLGGLASGGESRGPEHEGDGDEHSALHQAPRNGWSTARQRSTTTAIPADSRLRATSSCRIPCCIQTSCGRISRSCSSSDGMCSERRKMFTISMGPAAAADRRSGWTGSPRVTPPAGLTGTMV